MQIFFFTPDSLKIKPIKGSCSCKSVKKSIFFFHHYSIAYAFRNTHVKFQAGIRKIVEVMNFFVTAKVFDGKI